MKRFFPVINAVVAIAAGVVVLLGYFITNIPVLTLFRIILLKWSVLLAGFAVIIGIGNLFIVHFQKVTRRKPGAMYSLVLLVSFLITFGIIVMGRLAPMVQNPAAQKGFETFQNILLNGIMVPVEISLMAILAVTLLYSAVRMLRWRIDLKTILFLVAALLALITTGPLTGSLLSSIPVVGPSIGGTLQMIATGGARGILIGVALGTLTTGLRILLGADRPYGGK